MVMLLVRKQMVIPPMLVAGFVLAASVPLTVSGGVEASPAVVAIVGRHGVDLPPEGVKAIEALDAAGDRSATALLGEILWARGDFGRACEYSEKAGRQAGALHNLATCYFLGNGRPRDLERARSLYADAAGMGFAKAACAYGNMLLAGQGGPADAPRGLDLCRQAADAGEPDAQTDYGGYLLTGKHGARDAVRARHYLAQAAGRRHPNASFLLGQIYWNGDGVERDHAEASRWLRVAHEGGRPDAAFLIAMEILGRLVAASRSKTPVPVGLVEEAERWLRIAAEKDPDPKKRSDAARLLPDVAAMRRARD